MDYALGPSQPFSKCSKVIYLEYGFECFQHKTFKGWGVLRLLHHGTIAFSPSQFFPAQSLYHPPNIYLWLESKTLQPKLQKQINGTHTAFAQRNTIVGHSTLTLSVCMDVLVIAHF